MRCKVGWHHWSGPVLMGGPGGQDIVRRICYRCHKTSRRKT